MLVLLPECACSVRSCPAFCLNCDSLNRKQGQPDLCTEYQMKTSHPLRLIELKPKSFNPLKWNFSIMTFFFWGYFWMLKWHRFSVAANVTFIISFLFHSCVSSDLAREKERKRAVRWFSCPSHYFLCPCSNHFSVFPLWHVFSLRLVSPGVLLTSKHTSGEGIICRFSFTACILQMSTLWGGTLTLNIACPCYYGCLLKLFLFFLHSCVTYVLI